MEQQANPVAATADAAFGTRVVNRVMVRLIPFIVLLYIFNYLDRVNVAFAKLTMNADLGFSEAVYGFGAGIFFVSYFLFEVPSNLIMQRIGARIWLARIMISWGLISASMMFVTDRYTFYILRFLLGAAEAGFAPGILLYLTWWVPARLQARAVAWFLTSTALAGLIGSPLAGLLLSMDGLSLFGHPLHGWQWLFLLEGVPSVLGGFAVLFILTDRPRDARWLAPREREWLTATLEAERREKADAGHGSLRHAFTDRRVWLLNVIYCTIMFAFQGINFWLVTIVKQVTGLADNRQVGLLTAIPFFAAVVAMVVVGRHSDATGERRRHVAACACLGALALAACTLTRDPALSIVLLSLAAAGVWSTLGPFWAIPPAFLTGTAAAAGLAIINSVGNLGGGFFGPYVMGVLKDQTNDYRQALWCVSASLLLASILIMLLPQNASAAANRPAPASNPPTH